MNVEPSPGALFARISPPWDSAIWRAMESPRPAPPAAREGSVLWKRSKTRGSSSSGMPCPCPRPRARRGRLLHNLTGDAPPSGCTSRRCPGVWRRPGGPCLCRWSGPRAPGGRTRRTPSLRRRPLQPAPLLPRRRQVVAPDLEAGAFVAAGEGKERLDEGPHPTGFPADYAGRALSGSSSSAHSSSILAWPLWR